MIKCPFDKCGYDCDNLLVMEMHLNIIHEAFLIHEEGDNWTVVIEDPIND